jgi:hypothetical protein
MFAEKCSDKNLQEQLTLMQMQMCQLLQKIEDLPNTKTTTINNSGTVNTNHVTQVNVEIRPWGTPLLLTDKDVETVLARGKPAGAGGLTTKQTADMLMHAVHLAHTPVEARNVYKDPTQADQARVLTEGGWGVLQCWV